MIKTGILVWRTQPVAKSAKMESEPVRKEKRLQLEESCSCGGVGMVQPRPMGDSARNSCFIRQMVAT